MGEDVGPYSSVDVESFVPLPTEPLLYENYPNPFNPSTNISFDVANHSRVTLRIFDVLGRRINTLIDSNYGPGSYSYVLDGSRLASRVYFYEIKIGDFTDLKRMTVLK